MCNFLTDTIYHQWYGDKVDGAMNQYDYDKEAYMKTTRRLLVTVLALAMCASFLVFPALADEPISEHTKYEFRNYFPMMSRNSYKQGYTVALQCFLKGFPQSSSEISNSGGVDGRYGNGTYNAVVKFQSEAKKTFLPTMQVDGVTGGDTWAAVAHNLTYSNASPYYKSNGVNVMKPDVVNGRNFFVNTWGTAFHPIVGYIPEL